MSDHNVSDQELATSVSGHELGLDERLERLEAVVRELEREDQDLEEALRLFEEGVEHVRAARTALARAELTIERLVAESGLDDAVRSPGGSPER